MDISSGRILYEKNSHSQRLIASTTKIMTCILAIENGNLDDTVQVGEEVSKNVRLQHLLGVRVKR